MPLPKILVNICNTQRIPVHLKKKINPDKTAVENLTNFFQCVAPIVFGMISETTKIKMVIIADTIPTILIPQTSNL